MKAESASLLEKARRALSAAQRDLATGDADNAIARAYYAAFHAATAAIHELDLSAKTHKGTHQLFHQTYVETGRIGRRHSHTLARLFQDRQDADYLFEPGVFSLEAATDATQKAVSFVDTVEALLTP